MLSRAEEVEATQQTTWLRCAWVAMKKNTDKKEDKMHIGCKHLDYETKFDDCKIITIEPEGWKYWERGKRWTDGSNPKNVQFCKRRGRINNIFSCINAEMSCYEKQEEKNG
uniref:Uncharacterized protein n=1 Tax=viral metagenome TaxID=1070528 RepID=A0A6M3JL95_9ZZZZ